MAKIKKDDSENLTVQAAKVSRNPTDTSDPDIDLERGRLPPNVVVP